MIYDPRIFFLLLIIIENMFDVEYSEVDLSAQSEAGCLTSSNSAPVKKYMVGVNAIKAFTVSCSQQQQLQMEASPLLM